MNEFLEEWFATRMNWFPEWMAIPYTEVRAYAFNRDSSHKTRLLEDDGSFTPSLLNPDGVQLTGQQVQMLEQLINERPTGEDLGWMCSPIYRHAFAFFKDGQLVKHIEICFECSDVQFCADGYYEKPFDTEQYTRFRNILRTLDLLKLPYIQMRPVPYSLRKHRLARNSQD